MRDSVATEKYIRVLQELPAHRPHGKGWPSAWVTRLHARASMTTGRGAAHVRIMWPRVWSSLSMTNMAALGTLVSLITTTFSRLPSSGIRQQSKSSGLFVIGAARGEAGDLARVRAGAAPLPPTRRRRWGGQQRPRLSITTHRSSLPPGSADKGPRLCFHLSRPSRRAAGPGKRHPARGTTRAQPRDVRSAGRDTWNLTGEALGGPRKR